MCFPHNWFRIYGGVTLKFLLRLKPSGWLLFSLSRSRHHWVIFLVYTSIASASSFPPSHIWHYILSLHTKLTKEKSLMSNLKLNIKIMYSKLLAINEVKGTCVGRKEAKWRDQEKNKLNENNFIKLEIGFDLSSR